MYSLECFLREDACMMQCVLCIGVNVCRNRLQYIVLRANLKDCQPVFVEGSICNIVLLLLVCCYSRIHIFGYFTTRVHEYQIACSITYLFVTASLPTQSLYYEEANSNGLGAAVAEKALKVAERFLQEASSETPVLARTSSQDMSDVSVHASIVRG